MNLCRLGSNLWWANHRCNLRMKSRPRGITGWVAAISPSRRMDPQCCNPFPNGGQMSPFLPAMAIGQMRVGATLFMAIALCEAQTYVLWQAVFEDGRGQRIACQWGLQARYPPLPVYQHALPPWLSPWRPSRVPSGLTGPQPLLSSWTGGNPGQTVGFQDNARPKIVPLHFVSWDRQWHLDVLNSCHLFNDLTEEVGEVSQSCHGNRGGGQRAKNTTIQRRHRVDVDVVIQLAGFVYLLVRALCVEDTNGVFQPHRQQEEEVSGKEGLAGQSMTRRTGHWGLSGLVQVSGEAQPGRWRKGLLVGCWLWWRLGHIDELASWKLARSNHLEVNCQLNCWKKKLK